jgi:hypothetical protein
MIISLALFYNNNSNIYTGKQLDTVLEKVIYLAISYENIQHSLIRFFDIVLQLHYCELKNY